MGVEDTREDVLSAITGPTERAEKEVLLASLTETLRILDGARPERLQLGEPRITLTEADVDAKAASIEDLNARAQMKNMMISFYKVFGVYVEN